MSGDFDLTRLNDLDYSSTKTDHDEAGSGDLHHGRIAASKVTSLGRRADERDYTSAAQMLHALGANRIALLSNNPDKGAQLARLGITIARQVPTALHLTRTNAAYLATKARRGGHDLLSPPATAPAASVPAVSVEDYGPCRM